MSLSDARSLRRGKQRPYDANPTSEYKKLRSGWSPGEGAWKHQPLDATLILKCDGLPDLQRMMKMKLKLHDEDGIPDLAKAAYYEWKSALEAKWNVDLSIKGRGSVHGHQDYKKGICMKRLVLRGSNYVRDAFEEVLSLCDAGNVDFDDMYGTPLVMELCDKFKAEMKAQPLREALEEVLTHCRTDLTLFD